MKTYEHIFESKVGSYSHENGNTNYSECLKCGRRTDSHSHGDFVVMEEVEKELGNCDVSDEDYYASFPDDENNRMGEIEIEDED